MEKENVAPNATFDVKKEPPADHGWSLKVFFFKDFLQQKINFYKND